MIELLLLGGLLLGLGWYYWQGRKGLAQRVSNLLTQHVQRDAAEQVVFDGKQAHIVQQELHYGGDDATGPWIEAQLVCQMPSGQQFDVVVHTGHRQAPAAVHVAPRALKG